MRPGIFNTYNVYYFKLSDCFIPSRYPNVFMLDPSNCHNLWLLIYSQISLGIKMTLLPVSISTCKITLINLNLTNLFIFCGEKNVTFDFRILFKFCDMLYILSSNMFYAVVQILSIFLLACVCILQYLHFSFVLFIMYVHVSAISCWVKFFKSTHVVVSS